MARTLDYTISYEDGQHSVDLCKILFGGDGSYYITAPYHPLNRAIAAMVTVNYARQDEFIELNEAKDLAVLDDDERRLKLSHHPDGLLQFSGLGVTSGLDENRQPKGIGTFTWNLLEPALGPAFQLGFSDASACGRPSMQHQRSILFQEIDIEHLRKGISGLSIVGYYLPVQWREFVYRQPDGSMWMNLVHPAAQATKRLRVILASKESDIPGFIGLEALPHSLDPVGDLPSFFITSATGNLRRNDEGELIGDQLFCLYPQPDLDQAKLPSLNYSLPSPPYKAPPGTMEIFPKDLDT